MFGIFQQKLNNLLKINLKFLYTASIYSFFDKIIGKICVEKYFFMCSLQDTICIQSFFLNFRLIEQKFENPIKHVTIETKI